MVNPYQYELQRYDLILRDQLTPAIETDAAPVNVEVFQCSEHLTVREIQDRRFESVSVGWNWGPVWSTAWFRVRGRVPPTHAGGRCALRFNCGTEALVWRGDRPVQGLDANRNLLVLHDPARGGEEVDVLIEAACNHSLGAMPLPWDPPERGERWNSPSPGRLDQADLVRVHPRVWQLRWMYAFAIDTARELPEDGSRGRQLLGILRRVTDRIVGNADLAGSAPQLCEALAEILSGIRGCAGGSATVCHAVGHAHLDTAWLWTTRETRRKCLRTFANAVRNLERHADFRFTATQPQQYEWVKERSPELIESIKHHVKRGAWEAAGAMWVEPDCNVAGGESLIRQVLHGVRAFESMFGEAAPQRYLYLPDTFGFPACLPQIMVKCELRTFITNKLWWNVVNRFPHTTFLWEGLGGHSVLSHVTPGAEYNATLTPKDLRRAERQHLNKELPSTDGGSRFLQPFGFGDGGGGPTEWNILNAKLAANCEGLPRVRMTTIGEFCEQLHKDVEESGLGETPVWRGELFLEYHRGTYTSQARVKRGNRQCEDALRIAELMVACSTLGARSGADLAVARARLDRAWKTTLLNQFHDILPGSSIDAVYEDAARDHARILDECQSLCNDASGAWAGRIGGGAGGRSTGEPDDIVVLNPCSTARSGVVYRQSEAVWAEAIPALGCAWISRSAPPPRPVDVRGMSMSNGLVNFALSTSSGQVTALSRAGNESVIDPSGGSALWLFDDHPRMWDAWDVDFEHERHAAPVETNATIVASGTGSLRASLSVTKAIGERSSMMQTYVLDADSRRVDVLCKVQWRERHKLLRLRIQTPFSSTKAVFQTQFGIIERPTHRNTTHEAARFEVPGMFWGLVSEDGPAGRGLVILSESRYGWSCNPHGLGLSLLRAPTWPDHEADQGDHEFSYSLMPISGDWRLAGVQEESESLRRPLITFNATGSSPRSIPDAAWAPIEFRAEAGQFIECSAIKLAEESDRVIIRLAECNGVRGDVRIRPCHRGHLVELNMLERPLSGVNAALQPNPDGSYIVKFEPFDIRTFSYTPH